MSLSRRGCEKVRSQSERRSAKEHRGTLQKMWEPTQQGIDEYMPTG
ncbi:uncharacterized protein PITG_11682 [Phytophthora infestans T30-4]|uniref:Uncharacterized protein n=1 Tax=Phytophthora infestans (strain T30-4) TaxID=403677 RepID=D0NIB7_PHYIT|nr:uncharacterized protein PITG_11682 [Phytophthora infestans T30-4]EEY59202.1 hypothetical protein PITG_11682 [Phytophthora infestans T30-4]|eukprot:XP_002901216.1 hypothetical protein PITG_11682 [Phytophthora infestans T30-4]